MSYNSQKLFVNLTTLDREQFKNAYCEIVSKLKEENNHKPEDIPIVALMRLRDEYLQGIPFFLRAFSDWNSHFYKVAEESGIPAKEIEKDSMNRTYAEE